MSDPCHVSGEKQEGALEENKNPTRRRIFRIPPEMGKGINFHHHHVPVEGDRMRRFGEVTLHKPCLKAEGREGGSLELFLTSSFLSMWEMVNL